MGDDNGMETFKIVRRVAVAERGSRRTPGGDWARHDGLGVI